MKNAIPLSSVVKSELLSSTGGLPSGPLRANVAISAHAIVEKSFDGLGYRAEEWILQGRGPTRFVPLWPEIDDYHDAYEIYLGKENVPRCKPES